ncbi:MAG: hypothetical protein AB1426_09210 [Bacillota bacterium]
MFVQICPACGAENYSAYDKGKCYKCGYSLEKVPARPAGCNGSRQVLIYGFRSGRNNAQKQTAKEFEEPNEFEIGTVTYLMQKQLS